MKIITKPSVYLIARTAFEASGLHQFRADNNKPFDLYDAKEPEKLVEIAGRICYMSYGKGRKTNAEFIRNIVASEHFSVLEHANWTLLLTGISRSLSHEFIRHRHFSYSQLSQRYVDSKDVAFVVPPAIEDSLAALDTWQQVCGEALLGYEAIERTLALKAWGATTSTQKVKLIRQAARSVLPNCTETKMVVTGNARAWREFFDKRGSIHADAEIRRLACAILETLKPEAPTIFEDYAIVDGVIEKGGVE